MRSSARNLRQTCPSGGLCRTRPPGRPGTCGQARVRGPCDSRRGHGPAGRERWSCFPCHPPRPPWRCRPAAGHGPASPPSCPSRTSCSRWLRRPKAANPLPVRPAAPAPGPVRREARTPSTLLQPTPTESRRAPVPRESPLRPAHGRQPPSDRPETRPWASGLPPQSQSDRQSAFVLCSLLLDAGS